MLHGTKITDFDTKIAYEKINEYDKSPFNIMEVQCPKEDPALRSEAHWHNSLETVLTKNGSARFIIAGEKIEIGRNDIVVISPRMIHTSYVTESDKVFKGILIQVNYDYMLKLYPNIKNLFD